MNVLIFDVETTGLLPKTSTDQPVYITQLSFALYDAVSRRLIQTYNAYINIPEHVEISEKIIQLTGIDREKLLSEGIDIIDVLERFYDAYCCADIVVAHNLDFDSKVMEIEANRNYERLKNKNEEMAPHIVWMFDSIYTKLTNIVMKCTMKMSKELCNIERVNSRGIYIKFPTLCELYEKLFHTKPENLHNSMMDVLVCLRCYLKLDYNIDISDGDFYSYVKIVL
jgi:DNA polymerase III alpha subunit (gram-positive type)